MPIRVTNEEFINRVKNAVGDEYTPLTSYTKASEYVVFRHNVCGKTFKMSPNHFLKDGRRCAYCNHGNSKSPDTFIKQFNKVSNGCYTLLSSYHRTHEKVRVLHKVCGTEYMVTPDAFLSGEGCPKCFGNERKTTDKFKEEVASLTSGEYTCESSYKNNRTQVLMKHSTCGHIYKVRPHDFLAGNRCPYCRESKGERLVDSILSQLKIPYEFQKVFDDCGRKNQWLPFDFYVPEIKLLIEYDGIQHFEPVKYYGGEKKLVDQRRRDTLKNEYAVSHNMSILRIPYTLSFEHVSEELSKYIVQCKAEVPIPKVRYMI